MSKYLNDSNKIHYQVTRPVIPINDDGKGTFNISPIGFPNKDVSKITGVNPTLITPTFSIGHIENDIDHDIKLFSSEHLYLNIISFPYNIEHNISQIIGDSEYITITTVTDSMINIGESIEILGTNLFDGVYIVKYRTINTIKVLSTIVGNDVTGIVRFNVVEGDLVNVIYQDVNSQNGIYKVGSPWVKIASFYVWDGTENDNKEGEYDSVIIDGNELVPNHYAQGYSYQDTVNWLNNKLSKSITFGKFIGFGRSLLNQGQLIDWLLSGERINIGYGGDKQIWVSGFGLGNFNKTIEYIKVDPLVNLYESFIKRSAVSNNNRCAFWGLTNHHSRTFAGTAPTSPYVKDYPFIYNTEYNENDGVNGGLFPTLDSNVQRWEMLVPGVAVDNDCKVFDNSILFWMRDNSYHNNITLNLADENMYGRHNLVINHHLNSQDVIVMNIQIFTDSKIDDSNNRLTVANGNLYDVGDVIWFGADGNGVLPGGVQEKTTYFVNSIVGNSISFINSDSDNVLITTGGGDSYYIYRLAFEPYSNLKVKTILDNIFINNTYVNGNILNRVVDGNTTKYYYAQRAKYSVSSFIQVPATPLPNSILYDIIGSHTIRIYLEDTLQDYIDFKNTKITALQMLDVLMENNNFIPILFSDDEDISNLQQLYVYNDLVDYSLDVNNTAKIRSKKTFIHLPTPIELADGTPFEIDVSLPVYNHEQSFRFNTLGSLSGYKNYVTQPRFYLLSGYQKTLNNVYDVRTLSNTGGDEATLTLEDNIDVNTYLINGIDIREMHNYVLVSQEYSIGEKVYFTLGDGATMPNPLSEDTEYTVISYNAGRIRLSINSTIINLNTVGDGDIYITRKSTVLLCINGASTNTYNGIKYAQSVGRNKFTFDIPFGTFKFPTGDIKVSKIIYSEGKNGANGLTERNNSSIFGSNPESEYSTSDNVYNQIFDVSHIQSIDKRVLLATVYPTSTSTFAWRLDNDPQLRLLQWSLLNVNAMGGGGENQTPISYAYKKFKDIKSKYGNLFNFSIYDNPLSYNSNIEPTSEQQFINGMLRVYFPDNISPLNNDQILSNELYDSVGSYSYQANIAYKDLINDFHQGRLRVNSRKSNTYDSDSLNFEHGYGNNQTVTTVPTSLYDSIINFNTTETTNKINSDRWFTKPIYTQLSVLNAKGNTNELLSDVYDLVSDAYKNDFNSYTNTLTDSNAGNRYLQGTLNSPTDAKYKFSTGNSNKFIEYLIINNISNITISDVELSIWEYSFKLPRNVRNLSNLFNAHTSSISDYSNFSKLGIMPFAKLFSSNSEVPESINITDITDYNLLSANVNLFKTLKSVLKSNPIADVFLEDSITESFVSINTSNDDYNTQEFLRNYLIGYSNKMPFRFYNGYRTLITGTNTSNAHSVNISLDNIFTEMDVDMIYKYSVRDYLSNYVDSDDISKAINHSLAFKNNNADGNNVVAEDNNLSFIYLHESNPVSDPVNSTIKTAINVSGSQFLADHNFYREKMAYSYMRVKMKAIFSRKAGRWLITDYRQYPTSYLTPTIGNVALSSMEKSYLKKGTKGDNINDYIQINQPDYSNNNVYKTNAATNTIVYYITDSENTIFAENDNIILYNPTIKGDGYSHPDINNTIYTTITSLGRTIKQGNNWLHHIILDQSIENIKTDDLYISYSVNTINNGTYPNDVDQLNTDYIWDRKSCYSYNESYKELENTPYYKMESIDIKRGILPFLTLNPIYDSNGIRKPQLNTDVDLNADSYRFIRLLSPQRLSSDASSGINFVVPNNVHGGAIDNDNSLYLYQPMLHKVYWHMRPCVSVMNGTDIPGLKSYTGGKSADPVLNFMHHYPNTRHPEYTIPWHGNMSLDWVDGGLILIDADRDDFNGCTSIIIDAELDEAPSTREDYEIYDSNRYSL